MSKKMLTAGCMGSCCVGVESLTVDSFSEQGETNDKKSDVLGVSRGVPQHVVFRAEGEEGNTDRDADEAGLRFSPNTKKSSAEQYHSTQLRNLPSSRTSMIAELWDFLEPDWRTDPSNMKSISQPPAQQHIESYIQKKENAVECQFCGQQLVVEARFCHICGKPVEEAAKEQGLVDKMVPNEDGILSMMDSESVPVEYSAVPDLDVVPEEILQFDKASGSDFRVDSQGVIQISDCSDEDDFLKIGKYFSEKILGEGGFGKVHQVRLADSSTDTKYALKEMKNMKESHRKALEKERNLLQKLKHEHIVQYIDAFTENDALYIVLELANSGDLANHIEAQIQTKKQWGKWEICECFYQIVCGLNYLHMYRSDDVNGILHRDLKPQNVLVSGPPDCKTMMFKITDFGLARVMEGTFASVATFAGTRVYMSPEALNEETYSFATDIWALGCILYELCTLKIAFRRPADVLQLKLGIENLPVAIPTISSSSSPHWDYWKGLSKMCSEILDHDPTKRPTCRELLQRMIELKLPAWIDVRNLRTKDEDGNTPLAKAIINKDIRIVRALLELPGEKIGINEANTDIARSPRATQLFSYPLNILQLAASLVDVDPVIESFEPGCTVKVTLAGSSFSMDDWKKNLVDITGEIVGQCSVQHLWQVRFHPEDLRSNGIDPALVVQKDVDSEVVRNENRDAKALAVISGLYWEDVSRIVVKNRIRRTDLLALDQPSWRAIFSFLLIRETDITEEELTELSQREQEAAQRRNYERANDIKATLDTFRSLRYSRQVEAMQNEEESFVLIDLKENDIELVPAKQLRLCVVEALLQNPDLDVNANNEFGTTALHAATRYDEIDIVEFLLKREDLAANLHDNQGGTALLFAALNRSHHLCKLFLQREDIDVTPPNDSNIESNTHAVAVLQDFVQSLFWAIESNYIEIVKLLRAKVFPMYIVNCHSEDGITPLFLAVHKNRIDVLKFLLATAEINVNLQNTNDLRTTALGGGIQPCKYSALHEAVAKDQVDSVNLLLAKKDINANLMDSHGLTALHVAVQKKCMDSAQLLLTKANININSKDNRGATVLYYAASDNDQKLVKLLLTHANIDVNEQTSSNGETALFRAIANRSVRIVELLTDARLANSPQVIDLNLQDVNGDTALHCAIRNYTDPPVRDYASTLQWKRDLLKVIRVLLTKKDIDLNLPNDVGFTPFSLAFYMCLVKRRLKTHEGTSDVVELLLKRNEVDVNCLINGNPVLYDAVFGDHEDLTQLLLKHENIDVNGQTKSNSESALIRAVANCSASIVKFLTDASIDLNLQDVNGDTALHWAIRDYTDPSGRDYHGTLQWRADLLNVIRFLLTMENLNLNLPNKLGFTPFSLAFYMCLQRRSFDFANSVGFPKVLKVVAHYSFRNKKWTVGMNEAGTLIAKTNSRDIEHPLLYADGKYEFIIHDTKSNKDIVWQAENIFLDDGLPPKEITWIADDRNMFPDPVVWVKFEDVSCSDVVELLLKRKDIDVNWIPPQARKENPLTKSKQSAVLRLEELHQKLGELMRIEADVLALNPIIREIDELEQKYGTTIDDHDSERTKCRILCKEQQSEIFPSGNPLLYDAVLGDHEDLVKLLLTNENINVNAKNSSGETALSLARKNDNSEVVKLLEERAASSKSYFSFFSQR